MIYIKVEGIGRVQKSMTGYARRIPKVGRAGVWNFTQHLAKRLREEAPKGYSKRIKNSKYTYAKKLKKNEYAIIMPKYTKYLEEGTSKHWIPKTWKTVGWANMKFKWITVKGKKISPFAQMKYIIHKQGTKPHPFTAKIIRTEVRTKLKKMVEKKINDSIKRTTR